VFTPFVTAELARRYQTEGINAYVDLVQNKERELGVDIITHQKWSVSLVSFINLSFVAHTRQTQEWSQLHDGILTTVSSGSSSTSAVGADSTENQFH